MKLVEIKKSIEVIVNPFGINNNASLGIMLKIDNSFNNKYKKMKNNIEIKRHEIAPVIRIILSGIIENEIKTVQTKEKKS